ncbi:MAG: alanine racemase [Lachnospiraceae bacterium]|nr:alanine racemase [Lachnospiraceae bacterium]
MSDQINALIKESTTSFYVFDIAALKQRIRTLRTSLPETLSLCYAVKANPFLVKEIADEADRFEICSPGELEICRKLGIASEKMVISGVYKTPKMLEELAADTDFRGIVTIESLRQYEILCGQVKKYGNRIPVLLRLTNGSQFGIGREEIEHIVAEREKHGDISILGIQYFSGTQKVSARKLKREIEHLDQFLGRLETEYGYRAEELEYGTGFPVAYFEEDKLDEQELFQSFSQQVGSMCTHPAITIELGRSMAASCGQYYTHVVDWKQNKGQNYLLVDGRMHQMVYFGQYMAMKPPFFGVCGKEDAPKEEVWNICGSLCTMNDIILKQASLPKMELGDVLCFQNTGAYCMTEGISLFLSRDLPAVYLLLENGELLQVRKSYDTAELNMPVYE